MKTPREKLAVFLILSIAALLVLSYGTPLGRRAVRHGLRASRLARNFTGIYPYPSVTLRIWGGPEHVAFAVDVYDPGRLVVSGEQKAEAQLSSATVEKILEMAKAARADFNTEGCDKVTEGVNADLYVMVDGTWIGSVCRNALEWPRGPETRRLFQELRDQLPKGIVLPVKF